MPGGRPLSYNPDVAGKLLARMSTGQSVASIVQAEDMPCEKSVYNWLRKSRALPQEDMECTPEAPTLAQFVQCYAIARQDQAHHWHGKQAKIADELEGKLDAMAAKEPRATSALVQAAKVRIETYRHLAQIQAPTVYGTVQQHNHTHAVQLTVSPSFAKPPDLIAVDSPDQLPESPDVIDAEPADSIDPAESYVP